jgi:hypothetical protein
MAMAKKTAKQSIPRKSGQTTLVVTPSGGHKWTIKLSDRQTITTGTSGSSVSTIIRISNESAAALRRLAKK